MSKLYKIVRVSDAEIISILKSEEFYQDMEQVANEINPDAGRYHVERYTRRRTRAVARIVDDNEDNLSYEIETGTLANLGRGRRKKK